VSAHQLSSGVPCNDLKLASSKWANYRS